MYARVLNAEEKRSITQIHKAIKKPGFKLSDKAKQKLIGAFAIVSSIAALAFFKTDASVAYAFIMIPLGASLIFTKEKVIW